MGKLKRYFFLTFSVLAIGGMFSAFTTSDKKENEKRNEKDVDVMEMARERGIRTEVDESFYNAGHPGVKVKISDSESDIKINFFNLNFKKYKLYIYDVNGLVIGQYENFEDARASIDTRYLDDGTFLYKISGEGNIFAGKFELN